MTDTAAEVLRDTAHQYAQRLTGSRVDPGRAFLRGLGWVQASRHNTWCRRGCRCTALSPGEGR